MLTGAPTGHKFNTETRLFNRTDKVAQRKIAFAQNMVAEGWPMWVTAGQVQPEGPCHI